MKTISFLLLLALASFPASSAAQTFGDSLTVRDAIKLTLANQPQIAQAERNLAAADARTGASRSSLYPEISIAAGYTRLDPVSTISFGGTELHSYPNDNYDAHVELKQTIYDFGRNRTATAVSEAARQSVGDYIDLVRINLANQAVTAFNNILILQHTVSVIDSQIAALQQHAEISARRIQAGTATGYDTLTIRVRIAVAISDRTDAERALNSQMIVLRDLTGLTGGQPLLLRGDFAAVSTAPPLDSLLSIAERQRPDLVMALDAERVAEVQTELAGLGSRPTLSLAFASGVKNGYLPKLSKPKLNHSVGILFRMPVFNGRKTHYEELAAQAGLQAAKEHTADIRRQIETDVKLALLNVESSLSKIGTADVQVAQAEQAASMAATRYEAGVVTNIELLDANTALLQTRLLRLRALYDYTAGLAALDRATGKRIW